MTAEIILGQIIATIISSLMIFGAQAVYKKYKKLSDFRKIIVYYLLETIGGIILLIVSLSDCELPHIKSIAPILAFGCFSGTTLLFVRVTLFLDHLQQNLNNKFRSENDSKPFNPKK